MPVICSLLRNRTAAARDKFEIRSPYRNIVRLALLFLPHSLSLRRYELRANARDIGVGVGARLLLFAPERVGISLFALLPLVVI